MKLYDVDCRSALRMCPKLTDNHFVLPFGKKMKVSYAVQVLSNSVRVGLEALVISKLLPIEAQNTAQFVQQVDQLWNLMNCHTFNANNIEEIQEIDAFKTWIEKWTFINNEGKIKESLPFKKCFLITLASLAALLRELLTKDGHQSLCSRRINQDSLENTFSEIRQDRGGFDSNPELQKATQNLSIVSSANLLARNVTTNCENSGEYLFLDKGKK